MDKWLEKIKNERKRQISKKGYTPEHDDSHTDGSIADASAHFASKSESNLYPWDKKYDSKDKHTREEQLVIAGAMILAELERIDRFKLDCISKCSTEELERMQDINPDVLIENLGIKYFLNIKEKR